MDARGAAWWAGPGPCTHGQRMEVVNRIVARIRELYGQSLIAIGLYGSMAQGRDGPYSDIELFCVVDRPGLDESAEWMYGAGKAEVNFYDLAAVRRRAVEVDEWWPLRQGQFLRVRPLFGEPAFFTDLQALVHSPPASAFHQAIAEIVVAEFYEGMGKLRNERAWGRDHFLPSLACHLVSQGALMLGLAHRHCYTTGARLLEESLALPGRPDGYDGLCRRVMAGDLGDAGQTAADLERLWAGLGPWLTAMGIDLGARTRPRWELPF